MKLNHRGATPPARRPRRRPAPLAFEACEERVLLSFTVTSAGDSGPFTLRDAIQQVNLGSATGPINFSIGTGARTIVLQTPLPAVAVPVTIDGTTQPGSGATPLITVVGNGLAGDGLAFGAGSDGSVIKGLAVENFTGSGVSVQSNNVTVGGTGAADGNVLGLNSTAGVTVGAGVSGTLIVGNFIGVSPSGGVLANGAGVVLTSSSDNRVGGSAAGEANTIAANTGPAVLVDTGTGNLISQNVIYGNSQDISLVNGGNVSLPAPSGLTFTSVPGRTVVEGAVTGPVSGTYTVELFASASGDPTSGVYARTFLGSVPVTLATASSTVAFSATFVLATPLGVGQRVYATVTTPSAAASPNGNDTSSFATTAAPVNPFAVTNTNPAGIGSLRDALLNANANPGADTVTFAIAAAPRVITPAAALPTLTDPVTIDGTSQAGYAGVPLVTVNGTALPGGTNGFTFGAGSDGSALKGLDVRNFGGAGVLVQARNVTVGGTVAGAGNVLSANSVGVTVNGAGSTGVLVAGNFIGVDATSAALGNATGVAVVGAPGVVIGGTTPAAANVIGANTSSGVSVTGATAVGTVIQGNYVGTNALGANLGNATGVLVTGGSGAAVGGSASGARNYIGWNAAGVSVGGTAAGTVLAGNFIGVSPSGGSAPNTDGVLLNGGSATTVGGSASGAGNTVGFNTATGVTVGASATATVIAGNFIGTTAAAANAANATGVLLTGSGTTVGGIAAGSANVIGFNTAAGITLGGAGATGNVIAGNFIGTNAGGANLGNATGVLVQSGANNTIGGSAAGAANTIAFNPVGVSVQTGTGNLISRNPFLGNTQSIVLQGGGNLNQPAPTDLAFTANGSTLTVDGTVNGAAAGSYTLEFFSNDPADPTAPTFARNFLGSATVAVPAGGSAVFLVQMTLGSPLTASQVVYATVTAPGGNTSPFALGTSTAGPFVVTNTANSGIGSLRQAMLLADANPGVDTVTFAVGAGGPVTITPSTPLPQVTSPVVIDGTTQKGFTAAPIVQLLGTGLGGTPDGLVLAAGSDGSTLRGLILSGFAGAGVRVLSGNNLIANNYLGTDPAGTAAGPGNGSGVVIAGSNNVVGGSGAGAGNVIAFNAAAGVNVLSGSGNLISRNSVFANPQAITLAPGANQNQAAPFNLAYTAAGNLTTVQGNVTGAVAGTYTVEFFANGPLDPTTPVYARTFLGSATVNVPTPGGTGSFVTTLTVATPLTATQVVYATVTSPAGAGSPDANNTSTFGTSTAASNPFVVTTTADDGSIGTLRRAITEANKTPTIDQIQFQIPGAGPYVITLNAALGALPAVLAPLTIDGLTQTGGSGPPVVQIDAGGVSGDGLLLAPGSGGTTVRGLVIRGFASGAGVHVQSENNTIQAAYLGTDLAGGAAGPGNQYGVWIDNAPGNLVGGSSALAADVISGNTGAGVFITGASATGNTVAGNVIGLNAPGTAKVPNGVGVLIVGASGNLIGGATGDVISGNTGAGVSVVGPNASGNVIAGNFIGTNALGANLGNSGDGVSFSADASNNLVGGASLAAANTLAFNTGAAVRVDASTGDRVLGNTVVANGSGIVLTSGGNLLQPAPAGLTFTSVVNRTHVEGTVTGPKAGLYTVQFFASAAADPTSAVFARTFLGSATVNVATDNAVTPFAADFALATPLGATQRVYATVTSPSGVAAPNANNTSTFAVSGAPVNGLVVTTGANAGIGSLREAILNANAQPGADTVSFNLPSPFTVQPTAALPAFTGPVTVDGATQPGFTSTPVVTLDGSLMPPGSDGLTFAAGSDGSLVKTLVVQQFGGSGVLVLADNVRVGDGTSTGANVFVSNPGTGVTLSGKNDVVAGNFVGVTPAFAVQGNGTGVALVGATSALIGGTAAGAGNVISGNNVAGVTVDAASTSAVVQGNYVGTNALGANLGNQGDGLTVRGSLSVIGGSAAGAPNTIAFNTGNAVTVDTGTGNLISRNPVFANGGGIALVNGGNLSQPAVTGLAFTAVGTSTTFQGTVSGPVAGAYTVEFFASNVGDPATPIAARTFVGSTTVNLAAPGSLPFVVTLNLATALQPNQVVYATVTSPATALPPNGNNTSAFATSGTPTNPFVVTSTADDGSIGTLRRAITEANKTAALDTITFNIAGPGVHTIVIATPLPGLTNPVVIDGTSQPGYGSAPVVELAGTAAAGDGLTFLAGADNSAVKGLAVRDFAQGAGVHVAGATGVVLTSDYFGIDATTRVARPNLYGVQIDTANNTVGGVTGTPGSGLGNVISGNTVAGVLLTGANSTGNAVLGNAIGTDPGLSVAVPNGVGVIVRGLTAAGGDQITNNVISGNVGEGVQVDGSTGVLVRQNAIGTNALTGSVINLANRGYGISFINTASDNTVGGTPAQGNRVEFNQKSGLYVDSGTGNVFLGNTVIANGNPDIDFKTPASATAPPILNSSVTTASQTVVTFTLSGISGQSFTVEFFKNDPGATPPDRPPVDRQTFTLASLPTPKPVTQVFQATISQGGLTSLIATATLSPGTGTSTFSNAVTATPQYVVTTTADDGTTTLAGSLRKAIFDASQISGPATVVFNIGPNPGETPAEFLARIKAGLEINLQGTPLQVAHPITINGLSQITFFNENYAGAAGETLPQLPKVVIDGYLLPRVAGQPNASLQVVAGGDGSKVQGLVFNRKPVAGSPVNPTPIDTGLFVSANNVSVVGNFFGTDANQNIPQAGQPAPARVGYATGVRVTGAGNTVGGSLEFERNLFAGNDGDGLVIQGAGATSNVVLNSYFGTDLAGSQSGALLSNSGIGIRVLGASRNTIGGTSTSTLDVISGNLGGGVSFESELVGGTTLVGSFSNTLQNAYIGTNAVSTASLAYTVGSTSFGQAFGVQVVGAFSDDNAIGVDDLAPGGVLTATGVVVSGNLGNGVQIVGAPAIVGGTNGSPLGTLLRNAYVGIGYDPVNKVAVRVANTGHGVSVTGLALGTVVGSATPGVFTVISANGGDGVLVSNATNDPGLPTGAVVTTLVNARVGTDPAGAAAMGNGLHGVELRDASNVAVGLDGIAPPNVISGNAGYGVFVSGTSTNDVILNSYIGLTAAGTAKVPNLNGGVRFTGVTGNTLGSTKAGVPTVVSGNSGNGVEIVNGSTRITLQNAYIGTDPDGTSNKVGNTANGVLIDGSSNNTIGLDAADRPVVISGNGTAGVGDGVRITGASTGNVVRDAYVGTDAAGLAPLPNQGDGVHLEGAGVTGNLVGSATPGVLTLVSGNKGNGLQFKNAGNNAVIATYVGTDVTGRNNVIQVGNQLDGVLVDGAAGVGIGIATVGGQAVAVPNLISGNFKNGVHLINGATGTNLVGNLVGTDATGTATAGVLGNTLHGVLIGQIDPTPVVATSTSNNVGAVYTGFAYHVDLVNWGNGSTVPTTGRTLDVLVGIDGNGLLQVRVFDAAGNVKNFSETTPTPQITALKAQLAGLLPPSHAATPVEKAQVLQALAPIVGSSTLPTSSVVGGNVVSGNHGSGVYLGNFSSSNRLIGNLIGLSALDPNAPDFLGNDLPNGADGVTVSGSKDNAIGGTGAGEGNRITGNLGFGVQIIGIGSTGNTLLQNVIGSEVGLTPTVPTAAPTGTTLGNLMGGLQILNSGGNKVGDGTTAGRNYIAANQQDGVRIKYDSGTVGGGNEIKNNVISRNVGNGVQVVAAANAGPAAFDTLSNNLIGTDATGSTAFDRGPSNLGSLGNRLDGVYLNQVDASVTGNTISGNGISGLHLKGVKGTPGVVTTKSISGNFIGLDSTGKKAYSEVNNTLRPLGNVLDGILLEDSTGVAIGGTTLTPIAPTDRAPNVVSGNLGRGIEVRATSITLQPSTDLFNVIQYNLIGTDVTGTKAAEDLTYRLLSNLSDGIFLFNYPNTTINNNVVSNNRGFGIHAAVAPAPPNPSVTPATSNLTVSGNFVGTDLTGTVVSQTLSNGTKVYLGNGSDGVFLDSLNGDVKQTVKVVKVLANVIAKNSANGIHLLNSRAVEVQGNAIGTDVSGTASGFGNAASGVFLNNSSGNKIGGPIDRGALGAGLATLGQGNQISGNLSTGVTISGDNAGASDNVVSGNLIGTDRAGMKALPNAFSGVLITQAADNVVGQVETNPSLFGGNLISGNSLYGVQVIGAKATGNTVAANLIGTNLAEAPSLGNSSDGVFVSEAPGNTIGGDDAAQRNVIAANRGNGVRLFGTGTVARVGSGYLVDKVLNNTIVSNLGNGVLVDVPLNSTRVPLGAGNTPQGNQIGQVGKGNVIADNGQSGVFLLGSNSNAGTVVQGNLIGTDPSGVRALPNRSNGVFVFASSGNLIGGVNGAAPGLAAGNVISGNAQSGVVIFDPTSGSATDNTVAGNLIGTDLTGQAAVPNSASGVFILSASGNRVGDANGRNVISGNRQHGVQIVSVSGQSSQMNVLLNNFIGVAGSGLAPLGNQLDGVLVTGNATNNVIGTPPNAAPGSPTIANTNVPQTAANVIAGNRLAGVEFNGGANANYVRGNYIGVGSRGAGGPGLGNVGGGVIVSNPGGYASSTWIGGSDPGAGNIIAGSSAASGVELLGPPDTLSNRTSTGASVVAGNLIGVDAAGKASPNLTGVFVSNSAGNLVGGKTAAWRNVISSNALSGVTIAGLVAQNNQVVGNYIGTNAAGNGVPGGAAASQGTGVLILGASGNYVGLGSFNPPPGTPWLGNVISGNDTGVQVFGNGQYAANAYNNYVAGNRVGTNAAGTGAVPNTRFGVYLNNSPKNLVLSNLVSGNLQVGVDIFGALGTNNQLTSNVIGPDINGRKLAVANSPQAVAGQPQTTGVAVIGALNNVIGTPGGGNTISYNYQVGVYISRRDNQNAIYTRPVGNTVQYNTIQYNGIYGVLRYDAPANGVALAGPAANKFAGLQINLRDYSPPIDVPNPLPPLNPGVGVGKSSSATSRVRVKSVQPPKVPTLFTPGTRPAVARQGSKNGG